MLLIYTNIYTCTVGSLYAYTKSSFQDGGVQITWDNPSELEEYINKLQAAAERLTTENRRLRHCHAILVDKVSTVDIQ